MRALLAIVLLLVSGLGFSQGFDNKSGNAVFGTQGATTEFLAVEEAYRLAIEIQPDQSIRLYWQIEEAYYLYQHRFKFELNDASGNIALEVDFPLPVTGILTKPVIIRINGGCKPGCISFKRQCDPGTHKIIGAQLQS